MPILIGGHSRAALKRAAALGDGWVSANTDFDTLQGLVGQLNTLREERGTCSNRDFRIHLAGRNARSLDEYRALAALGATDACVTIWNPSEDAGLETKLTRIERFAERFIGKVSRRRAPGCCSALTP